MENGVFFGEQVGYTYTATSPGASFSFSYAGFVGWVWGSLLMPKFTDEEFRTRTDLISVTVDGKPVKVNDTTSATVVTYMQREGAKWLTMSQNDNSFHNITVTLGPAFEGNCTVGYIEYRQTIPMIK